MEICSNKFRCVFCERGFNRLDSLRRHWATCNARLNAGYNIPHVVRKTRGKKPRACDRCARLRRACNSTQPCVACAQHRTNCTYDRIPEVCGERGAEHRWQLADVPLFVCENQQAAASTTWNAKTATEVFEHVTESHELNLVGSSTLQVHPTFEVNGLSGHNADSSSCFSGSLWFPRPTDLDMQELKTFPFLHKLASTDGLGNVFACGNLSRRTVTAEDLRFADNFHFDDLRTMQSVPSWLNPAPGRTPLDAGDIVSEASPELLIISETIISMILQPTMCDQYLRQHKLPCGDAWKKQMACHTLFSPTNLQRYLALYWSCWHPNWPVIHKPSFSTVTTSPVLVAAMAVIGACLSAVEVDRGLARLVFDAVEETVYNDEAFSFLQPPISQECLAIGDLRTRLETLLAAYCVCLYQTWEGDKIAKRRVCRQRYGQVICLARDIGSDSATLRQISTDRFAAFKWEEFALRESLARTFAYINNLDTGLAMFYQVPIRMPVSELAFDLSTPEACFGAESAEDCFAALKVWRDTLFPQQSMPLSCAVAIICSEHRNEAMERMISRLSVLSMFTIVSTLYKLANQLEGSLVGFALSPALNHGLRNWRRLWPSEYRDFELLDVTEAPNGLWMQRIGFQRYAPEYWLYTYLTVERAQHRSFWDQAVNWDMITHDDTDKIRFKGLLREFESMTLASE